MKLVDRLAAIGLIVMAFVTGMIVGLIAVGTFR